MNKRDGRGWRVPRSGTKSRMIYELMGTGLSHEEIALVVGGSINALRVLLWKIRHHKDANAAQNRWWRRKMLKLKEYKL